MKKILLLCLGLGALSLGVGCRTDVYDPAFTVKTRYETMESLNQYGPAGSTTSLRQPAASQPGINAYSDPRAIK